MNVGRRGSHSELPTLTLALLGGLSAFGPISTDVYLPGIPALARDLGVSASQAQLTISVCLLGLACGQVIAGIASDVLGRRGLLLIGLVGYLSASLGCAVAPEILSLLVLRLLQGVCGGAGIAIARAVVRDRCQGESAARAYGLLMVVAGLGPILAPVVGGLLLHVTNWRGIFLALAVIAALLLAAVVVLISESLPQERRRSGAARATRSAFRVLTHDRPFVRHTIVCSLAQSVAMAFIAGSPFVLEHGHHLSPGQFSLLFAGIGACGVFVRLVSVPATRRFGPATVLDASCRIQSAGAGGVLACALLGTGLVPLVASLAIAVGTSGAILPAGVALAMEDHPSLAGSASGLFGFAQSVAAGSIAPLVGIGGGTAALPMAVTMATCAWSALAVSLIT